MKNKIIISVGIAMSMLTLNSCELENVLDPNFPGVETVTTNASKAQLDALAIGQYSLARNGLATYTQVAGVVGKELFNFNSTESRWWTELNGLRPIDNSAFYNTATTGFGLPVRQANILIKACDNTTLVTDAQKNGYKGIANTFKALAYLYMLNAQGKNGVRLNVEDPFNPSKPASYTESLAGIATLLDQGATQLDGAGAAFAFTSPSGFVTGTAGAAFNSPATFKRFNRAIAARVALYQADYTKAQTALTQSFYDINGDINLGPKHTFNPSNPDVGNPLLNSTSVRIVGNVKSWDAMETGDKRAAKVAIQTTPITYSAGGTSYTSKYLANMYKAATDVAPIIRNEELMLIAAEIAANTGATATATANINAVRKANGLGNYAGATTKDALINAILKERFFSLWYEGHRWVDMRRLNKLAEIDLPVAGMKVLENMERPVQEVNWDNRVVK
jgi:starch-binding outer membrane protein, SusD/RagB family